MILDATCSPSNIRYPQDFSLLNEAREKTELMIDRLHARIVEKHRPRTYRRVLHAQYLAMAKAKKRSSKKVRALIYKLLCSLKRNFAFIAGYQEKGLVLPDGDLKELEILKKLYAQQKKMFDESIHRVDKRIVSLSQPHLRPIVRGKVKTPVEFGAKYDVSIDEKGHARIEKLTFDPYNESEVLKGAVENYRKRTGHYPLRVLVDQIYRTKDNRAFCVEHGIRMTGRGPGRPSKKTSAVSRNRKQEQQDNVDRIEVERFFSREKRTCGASLITTRLAETTLASIALSVFVANLFGTPIGDFFALFIWNTGESDQLCYVLAH